MLKPATGTVSFEDEHEPGVFIRRDDADVYAKAITEVLLVLERNPSAVEQLGVIDLKALRNLGHLVKGKGVALNVDLRRFVDCLKR